MKTGQTSAHEVSSKAFFDLSLSSIGVRLALSISLVSIAIVDDIVFTK